MYKNQQEEILSINNLVTEFQSEKGKPFRAVDRINLSIKANEIYGLVGESGCGKTVSALSIMRLIDRPGIIKEGTIIWNDVDLLKLSQKEMQKKRGKEIAMIFQDPQAALNPLYTIGDQLRTIIRIHQNLSKKEAIREAIKYLEMVKIADPERLFKCFPHQMSGGQCQRVMIAMALSCRPKLLIADEPTSALDVTIQAQILDLLFDLHNEFDMTLLLISHDMGVVANMCDRVSVMYLGRTVEEARTEDLFNSPKHPYTKALLSSILNPKPNKLKRKITVLNSEISTNEANNSGCRFRNRCSKAFKKCSTEPILQSIDHNGHKVACWIYHE